MYFELVLITIIVFYVLINIRAISPNKFIKDYNVIFELLKEKDYEFLLKLKYGDNVIDANQVFRKRIINGISATVLFLVVVITNLKPLYILIAVVIGFLVFKSQYMDLKTYYRKHLSTIDSLLPYFLKSIEVLIQHYTIPVALSKSIEDAPDVFKPGLRNLVAKIEMGDSSINPYMDFANEYPVRDSMRMMRLLYRLSLGEQESKHEQMLSFSKTVSVLQLKAREQKYKLRLNTMERMTMKMLVCTGGLSLILMLIAAFSMIA